MKKTLAAVAVGFSLWLGCGQPKVQVDGNKTGEQIPGETNDIPSSENSPSSTESSSSSSSQSSGLTVSLRVLGDNNPGLTQVLAKVSDLRLEANGVQIPISGGITNIDLANTSQAWFLGSFTVPDGVEQFKATLRFDDFGSFSGPDQEGWVDFRGSPISVDVRTSLLQRHHQVVIQFDLDKMLAKTERPEERIAVTHLVLRY